MVKTSVDEFRNALRTNYIRKLEREVERLTLLADDSRKALEDAKAVVWEKEMEILRLKEEVSPSKSGGETREDQTQWSEGTFVHIKSGWYEEGRIGRCLGSSVYVGGQWWTPVLWEGEEDPDWHKSVGLEAN